MIQRIKRWLSWRLDSSPYCATCGACGHGGCCPPSQCHVIRCLHGEDYKQQVKDDEKLFGDQWDAIEELLTLLKATWVDSDHKDLIELETWDGRKVTENETLVNQLRTMDDIKEAREHKALGE